MVDAIAQVEGLTADDLQDGRRWRRVNHIVQMIQLYHRQARSSGQTSGFKKRAAVAAALWPDVENHEDVRRKWKQLRQWELVAERAGLLRVWDGRGARALGWELLDGWQRYAGGPRGYSSVGSPIADRGDPRSGAVPSLDASCEARRRRESGLERHERRVRRHCRRVGNKTGAVPRLLPPHPSSKRRKKSQSSGLGSPPSGASPTSDLVDAPARTGRPTPVAAPDRKNGSTERGAAEAERIFAATFGPPAGGRLVIVGPLLAALDRVDRESALMAELNGWRAPQGAGLSFLEQLVGSEADARREEGRRPPRHLGYFVKPLRAEARRVHRKRRQREQPPTAPREPPPRAPAKRERPADTAAGRAVQRMLRDARQYDRLAAANPRWAETYRREADRLRQAAWAKAEPESRPLPQRG